MLLIRHLSVMIASLSRGLGVCWPLSTLRCIHTSSVFWTTLEGKWHDYPYFSDERSERLRIFFKTASLINDRWDLILDLSMLESKLLILILSQIRKVTRKLISSLFLFPWVRDWLTGSQQSGTWLGQQRKAILFAYGSSQVRRRQWHPTPVLLPGKSHGWRSLVGCSPWGH